MSKRPVKTLAVQLNRQAWKRLYEIREALQYKLERRHVTLQEAVEYAINTCPEIPLDEYVEEDEQLTERQQANA